MNSPAAIAAALGAGSLDPAGALAALAPFVAGGDPDALALAGFCRLGRGETGEAAALLDEALARQPGHWLARVNRAETRRVLGRWREAADDYRAALAARPAPELYVNLALALRGAGDPDGERAALEEALRLDPGSAGARNNLGLSHETAGRDEEALACYLEAARLAPAGGETADDVGQNLGRALFEKGRRLEMADPGGDAARRFYEDAISRHPELPGLHLGLGLYWLDRHEVAKGEEAFARLLALCPDDPDALTNYGVALERLGRSKEALVSYHKASDAARKRHPDRPPSAMLRWNRAISLLALGQLREGFAAYEGRAESGATTLVRPPGAVPPWNGERFDGGTLLLCAEQGYGDSIQFLRYAALAKALSPGGTVAVACPGPLARLFATAAGVDRVAVPPAWPARADFHLHLMSLPRVFGTELATVPAAVPYFVLPPAPEPGPGGPSKIKIALVWSGNPRYANDRRRSCPLPLIEEAGWPALPGVEWHSFQTGPEAGLAAGRPWLKDRSGELADFYETALRLRECSLVVTVDTAAAHLAGALGLPVWVLLPLACDWRWLRRRDDSPWYPTARLFRHPAEGDWRGCLAEVTSALEAWLGNFPPS